MIARVKVGIIGTVMALFAAGLSQAAAQQPDSDGRFLGRKEILLYGLNLSVDPGPHVVPKDVATIVKALLQVPEGQLPPDTVSPFAPDAETRATLRGPGLAAPLDIAVKAGLALDIPPLKMPGLYTLDNIRLVSGGEVLLRGNPESVRIEVIDKLLVTQVTARPLTADEIREKGIVFDRTNFQAYNFTAAFAIKGENINVSFPILLPRLAGANVPTSPVATIPDVPTASIPRLSTIIPDTLKLQTKVPNLQVVGFSLKVPEVKDGNLIVPPIPGMIAIPGDIAFLNQFFRVLLMVGNAAPPYSGLVLSNLEAEILLPPGRNAADPADDPLRMAMTTSGESPKVRLVVQPGADEKLGTADDVATIGPGESGNAEYLVEGVREGSHVVEMRIKGTLNGLAVGPIEIKGNAKGAVLVRNPTFSLTFTHPEVVSAGEQYTLDVTISNTSTSPANFVSVNLQPADIGGATLIGDPVQSVESIPPGDSATVSFKLQSKVTGKVFAATLDGDVGLSGRFALKTSVGELGVPLSPDSLVLPKEAGSLPPALRPALIGLLGKAWAVATAPPAAIPAGLQPFSRKIVLDRAVEAAEAGLRIDLEEPVPDSVAQLAFDVFGSNYPRLAQRFPSGDALDFEQKNYHGFDLLRRRSIRGDVFAEAVANALRDQLAPGAAEFHKTLAEKTSYRPGVISVLASAPGAGALPVRLAIADAAGRTTGGANAAAGKITKDIPFSELLPFKDGAGTLTAQMALVGAPTPGTFTVKLSRAPGAPQDTPFTLSVVVPTANDGQRQIVFENLVAGQKPVIAFADGVPYKVVVEWVDVATTATVTETTDQPIADPAPRVISVIQREKDDKILCDQEQLDGPHPGRIVAVLFSEEVTPASVQDKARIEAITNYAIDGNTVVGVALQPGRRILFLALRDPYGPHLQRSLTISNVKDARGNVIAPDTKVMKATVKDPAGRVSGQVLRADGTPAAFVNVRLFYRSPCDADLQEVQWIGISSKLTDAEGRFSWDYVLTSLPARIVAVDPETGDVRNARFHVRGDGQLFTVNLVFLGRGTLTGRTFGPDGRTPLTDTFVRVTSMTDQSQYAGRTDGAGRYSIANVPVGSFVIEAVNEKAIARTTESDLMPFAGATVTRDLVLLDAKSEPITVKRGTVKGFVLEADGRTPAIGVPVIAYYQTNSQPGIPCPRNATECPVGVTTTSTTGAYEMPDVPAGSLRIQTFNQASYEQGEIGVVLAANQTLSANIVLAGGLGTVKGVVLDPSGKPVKDASVGGGISLVTTDDNGLFTLTHVPIGRREIVAVSNEVGALARTTVDLLYAGHEVHATLVLDAMGSVAGVVTKGTAAVSGIQVYVFKKEGENVQVLGSATTAENGSYRIDRIPLGDYRVSAFNADFSDGNIVPAVVKFHKQVVRADVKFRGGGGRVKGGVFADPEHKTPLRARVSLSGEQVVVAGGVLGVEFRRVENFRIVDTSLSGAYSMGGLFVGPFTIRAAGPFSPDPIAVPGVLENPGDEVTVNLTLQPTSQLKGVVRMPDGTPVGADATATVHFKSDSFKTVCTENAYGETICENFPQGVQDAEAFTHDDGTGEFLFPILNPGKYTLTVDGPGGRKAIVKGSLAAGQTGEQDIRLLGRAPVTVNVYGSDRTTVIPKAKIEVSQVGAPIKKAIQQTETGTLTFSGPDAFNEGEIVVIATNLENGATGRARGVVTQTEAAVTVDVFIAESSGVVKGKVLRPNGRDAAPNVEVVILQGGSPVAFATTNAEGKYEEIGIPLGAIRVEIFDPATGRRGAAAGQLATSGTQLELNVIEEALGVVRGQVVQAVTLQPLTGWRVTLGGQTASGRSMPPLVTTTGIDGGFSFPGTPLGNFTVTATKPGQAGHHGSGQGSIVREGQLVEVPVIATIPRNPVGTIVGTVVDHLGAAVPNARLEITRSGASGPTIDTAKSDGSFEYGPAPLGRYYIKAIRQGSTDSGATRVDLQFDGRPVATSVVLNGLSTIIGVVRQNGNPVPFAKVSIKGQPQMGCAGAVCFRDADQHGRFTFEQVSARTFTVTATDPNGVISGSIGDTINPGETKDDVVVVLEATRKLAGRVVDSESTPVAGIVGEVAIGSRRFFAESGPDGLFEFTALPLGSYTLKLSDPAGPGLASRRGQIAIDVNLGDVKLDEAPPRVAGVTPLPSALAVPRTQSLTLQFSEGIDRGSIDANTIRLVGPSGPVAFEIPVYSDGDSKVVLQPSAQLEAEAAYTLTVLDVRDRAGREMAAPYTTTFKTVDVTAPAVAEATPTAGTGGNSAYAVIRIRMSEAVAPPPPSAPPVLRLLKGTAPVDGRVDFILGNTVVVFSPALPMDEDTTYRVQMDPLTDLSGNTQAQALDYTFMTTDRTPPQITRLVPDRPDVIENGTVNVTAEAAASEGISYIDFYVNGQLAYSATAAPFVFGLKALPAYGAPGQSIIVWAYATDASGNRGPRVELPILIKPDVPPGVTLQSPANGASVANGATINIEVHGTDDLSLKQIGYRLTMGQSVRTSASNVTGPAAAKTFPFQVPADAAPGAVIRIEPTALDTKNQATVGSAVELRVSDATPPTVSITGTTSGSAVEPNDDITVFVLAKDGGRVKTVTFTASGAASFTRTETIDPARDEVTAGFTFKVPATASATQTVTLKASATDGAGNTGHAADVVLPVADLVKPTITLRTANGRNEMVPGALLEVIAEANDEIGVSRIELTGTGAMTIADARTYDLPLPTAPEHTFTIQVPESLPDNATLQLQARAFDKAQNIGTSATLTITAGTTVDVTLPASTIVNAGTTQSVAVGLTAAAGASGVRVDLSTEHPLLATVSTPVLFAQGETSKSATITAFAGGTTTLIARVQGVERARMTIAVQGGIVKGAVLDPHLDPVVGADVIVTGGGVTKTATSGDGGAFEVQGIPGPHVEIRARHEQSGLYGRTTATMSHTNGSLLHDVVLMDAGSVKGSVTRANGDPAAPGTKVEIFAGSDQTPAQTVFTQGDQGDYEFPFVTVGTYRIDASDEDGNRGRVTNVMVEGGKEATKEVKFLGRGTVTGVVRTAGDPGQTVAGADLTFESNSIFGRTTLTRASGPQGQFEFTNVFVGDVSVKAVLTGTFEKGLASGKLEADQGVVDLVVTLSPVGSLEGVVERTDHSTAPGAKVTIVSNSTNNSLSTSTNEDGRYSVEFFPAGAFTAKAHVESTREKGMVTGAIIAGQPAVGNITLVPQGRLRVIVQDHQNQPVAGASVTVSVGSQELGDTLTGFTTGGDGIVLIDRVMAANYTVTATKSGVSVSKSGMLAAGQTPDVLLKFEARGTIEGTVYLPGRQQTADGGEVRIGKLKAPIGENGHYQFDNLLAGTYELTVYDAASRYRAVAQNVTLTSPGEEVKRDIEMIGLGTVKGRVLNGSTPMDGVSVTVKSGSIQKFPTTDGGGYYEATDVLFGAITVSATSGNLTGDASGVLDRETPPLTLDIVMGSNVTTLPQDLYDANAVRFNMQKHGGLSTTFAGFYNAFLLDIVAGGQPIRFAGEGTPRKENGGREIATSQADIAGLTVTRKLFVPSTGYFGRWLEILSNPTNQPITVDVRLTSFIGNAAESTQPVTSVIATSSGDEVLDVESDTPDRWVVVDDATDLDPFLDSDGVPALAFVFDGPAGAMRAAQAAHTVNPSSNAEKNAVQYTWTSVTIQPGQRVALMHFGVRQTSRASAAASAARLEQLPPEALSGLNSDEIPLVRNWAVPQDGNSALAALPAVNGRVTGRVLTGLDPELPLQSATVTFKSDSPYYGRTYSTNQTLADGTFTLQSVLAGSSPVALSLGDTFTLNAKHPDTLVAAPPVAADFAEGQTQRNVNVIFSNTGQVKGHVRRHNGAAITSSEAILSLTVPGRSTAIQKLPTSDGFRYTGVPEGQHVLTVEYLRSSMTGTKLTGQATFTITANETVTQDVFIEPTGSVTGVLKNGGGATMGNHDVTLKRAGGFSRTVKTDPNGRYTFIDVPVGQFTVEATEAVTKVTASLDGTVVQDQETPMDDLVLMGYGTLNVQVQWGDGRNVDRAVSVKITEVARTQQRPAFTTSNTGFVSIPSVTTSGWTLRATHPVDTTQFTEITGTIAHGETKNVAIKLPIIGSVKAIVRYPRNIAPGQVAVDMRGDVTKDGTTNTQGDFTFTNVPAGKPFTLRAYTSTSETTAFYRDSGPHQITAEGQLLEVPITLPARATLKVKVMQGDQPATTARVSIKHAFATAFTTPLTVDGSGERSYTNTPEGVVQIRATTAAGAILAEGEATITADDHAQTVSVTLQAGITLPKDLKDANDFLFDIAANGRTIAGTKKPDFSPVYKAYDSGLELKIVADGTVSPFLGSEVAQLEANGRELVIRNPDLIAGLDVTRKIFVPATGYFARYLEILRNPTDDPITVELEVASDLDSEAATVIVDQNAGQWIVTDDDPDNNRWPSSDQALAHVFAGLGTTALAPPLTTLPTASADTLSYRWAVTVPARQRVAVMHFAAQQPSQIAAQASAIRLAQLPPEALVDLSAEEIAAIGNFEVPADGVGTVPPLVLAPAFNVTGQIFTHDNELIHSGTEVILRSGNPIYSREARNTNTPNVPNFNLTTVVADSWVIEANNRPPAPFGGWVTPRQMTHALAPGQTSAQENIVFSGTGTVTGRVHYSNNAAPTSGGLTIVPLAPNAAALSQLANGTFALPVVPAGAYTMKVNINGRMAEMPVAVAPDADTLVDFRIPARASVKVIVKNPDGNSPAVNARVTLSYPGNVQYGDTDGSGAVTFLNIDEGDFSVHAREANNGKHIATVKGAVTADDEARLIEVPVTLKAIATLKAIVTRGGNPVQAARLMVRHSELPGFEFAGFTATNGELLIPDVPAGAFEVIVRDQPNQVTLGSGSGSVPQTAEGLTIDVPIALTEHPATVKGTLFGADGQTKLRGYPASVRLFDGDREIASQPTELGTYEITGVTAPASGSLRVRAECRGAAACGVEQTVQVSEDQTVTADFTLPVNGVTGTVRLWDGTRPSSTEVYVEFAAGEFYQVFQSYLDLDGRYAVWEVPAGQPAGDFTATAWTSISGSPARAVAAGTVQGSTDVITADIVLGRVTGTVHYAGGTGTVDTPAVFATQQLRPGLDVTYDASVTLPDGRYVVYGPQPGAVTVTAQKMMLEGTATATLPSASPFDVAADVELEADGAVFGTVTDANDVPLADAEVMLSIAGIDRTTRTDGSGRFQFEHVKRGPFALQAKAGSGSDAQYVTANGVLGSEPLPAGGILLKLPATGVVGGQVFQEGGQGVAADAEVIIQSLDHTGPLGAFSAAANANGSGQFSVSGVPVGQVKVSAFSGLFGGWTIGALTTSGPAALNVEIGSLVKLTPPYALDSSDARFSISCHGRVAAGGQPDGNWFFAYANAFALTVGDATTFPCVTAASFEDNRRELTLDGGVVNGLALSRKIYVPESGGYARFLEVLTNTGAAARTVHVRITGGLGRSANRPTLSIAPATTGRTYAVSHFDQSWSMGFVFAGQGNVVGVDDATFSTGATSPFSYEWSVTVPPGQTVILMHFTLQGADGAQQVGVRALELMTLSRPGMLDGMTSTERAQVVNFRIQ